MFLVASLGMEFVLTPGIPQCRVDGVSKELWAGLKNHSSGEKRSPCWDSFPLTLFWEWWLQQLRLAAKLAAPLLLGTQTSRKPDMQASRLYLISNSRYISQGHLGRWTEGSLWSQSHNDYWALDPVLQGGGSWRYLYNLEASSIISTCEVWLVEARESDVPHPSLQTAFVQEVSLAEQKKPCWKIWTAKALLPTASFQRSSSVWPHQPHDYV